jgi:hypothetical protein
VAATPLRVGLKIKGIMRTLMHLFSICLKSTFQIIVQTQFTLPHLVFTSVVVYWDLVAVHSMAPIEDTAKQAKVIITTSKGMYHHSPTRKTISHVLN